MAAVNPFWHRWIFASVAKHLKTAATAGGVTLNVSMLDQADDAFKALSSRAEATISGPRSKEVSKGEHRVIVDVFITVSSLTDETANNYDHIDKVGILANALDQCVLVKDYGPTGTGGTVTLGVLQLVLDDGDEVTVIHVRPAEKDNQVHSTIAARLQGYISE